MARHTALVGGWLLSSLFLAGCCCGGGGGGLGGACCNPCCCNPCATPVAGYQGTAYYSDPTAEPTLASQPATPTPAQPTTRY